MRGRGGGGGLVEALVPPPAGCNDSDSWYVELREAEEEPFAEQGMKQMLLHVQQQA